MAPVGGTVGAALELAQKTFKLASGSIFFFSQRKTGPLEKKERASANSIKANTVSKPDIIQPLSLSHIVNH
jgi:hypothetical protein